MSRTDGYWVPKKEELHNLGLDDQEATGFVSLCKRYLAEHQNIKESLSKEEHLKIQPPSPQFYKTLEEVPVPSEEKLIEYLNKIVVIKLNGGIGTTMGLDMPRCALPLNADRTFLDVIIRQIQHLNTQYKVNVPLVLMNSVHNNDAVLKIVSSYNNNNVNIYNFVQSCYPRLSEVTWSVVAKKPVKNEGLENWYPPGSGDVFESFYKSGLLEKFIAEGKEYVFISRVENLGATVFWDKHPVLPQVFTEALDFIVEVTERKSTDHRGGILVHDQTVNKPYILQLSQIPKNKRFHFSPKTYTCWNTNNIWVNMKALLDVVKGPGLNLPVSKNIKNGFIQLETYAGSAIADFKKVIALVVPRTRYREVKTTANLFCLQSNLFTLAATSILEPNATRVSQGFEELPIVRFDIEHFGSFHEYKRRFPQLPNILELEHLNVAGDVTFGMRVKLMGTVIIVAEDGKTIHIPDGSVLENCVVTGELQVLDH